MKDDGFFYLLNISTITLKEKKFLQNRGRKSIFAVNDLLHK